MDRPTGITHAILQRLPHFYTMQEETANNLLSSLVETFGRTLERSEIDTLRVLRAHHVETADNVGSRGYTAPMEQRGDLDKIFALYLESIGGTTELVKMTPRFSARSLQVQRLATQLTAAANAETGTFPAYLLTRLQPSTRALLACYTVENAWFQPDEIQPGFAVALLLGRSTLPGSTDSLFFEWSDKPTVATYLRRQLTVSTRRMLNAYSGAGALPPALAKAMADDLNQLVLRNAALYRKHADEFEQQKLSPTARLLLRGIYPDFLRERYAAEADPAMRTSLLAYLDATEAIPLPAGDDLVRLNRLLLEQIFPYDAATRPWGLKPRQIPALEELRTELLVEFNHLLDGEELFRPAWFPDLADDYPRLRQQYRNDRSWLNRLVLENAFPTAIEKSYTPYQERLRGLIQVLRRGASTRDGIIALVAANLGIVDDTPTAYRQRERIRVEEFDPFRKTVHYADVQPFSRFVDDNPRTRIVVENPNLTDAFPDIQFTVHLRNPALSFITLTHWSIINRTTGQHLFYDGALSEGDCLALSSEWGMRVNGVPVEFASEMLGLPPGTSLLEIEAMTALRTGRSDSTLYDLAMFADAEDAEAQFATRGIFDETCFGQSTLVNAWSLGSELATRGVLDESVFDGSMFDRGVLDHLQFAEVSQISLTIEISMMQITPGRFRVSIPWDLGDFPADVADPAAHPRNQIQSIIDKVRAAGVFATISYEQRFTDVHDVGELAPSPELTLPTQETPMAAIHHAMEDHLVLAGAFDYMGYDSLNGFA
ncbi:MAG: hypothetical protein KGS73_04745 [Chloroflexi bacterium]|nr:hypothetical protein [Chloroflexota bacterium]